MTSHLKLALAAVLVSGAGMFATGTAHAECRTIGAVGTGVTEGIAKFMADAALKNIRADRGYKASGNISYKCRQGMIAIDCSGRQRVCK